MNEHFVQTLLYQTKTKDSQMYITTSQAAKIRSWAEFDQLFPGKEPCPNVVKMINGRDKEVKR